MGLNMSARSETLQELAKEQAAQRAEIKALRREIEDLREVMDRRFQRLFDAIRSDVFERPFEPPGQPIDSESEAPHAR